MTASRWSFVVLVAVVAITLGIGSVHAGPPSAEQRIQHLDEIIKCPSCAVESIAQSNASPAVGLRLQVARMVREGQSDAAVEHYAVARYGPGELLVPNGGLSTFEWAFPLAAVLAGAA